MLAKDLPALLKNLLTTVDNAINQISNASNDGDDASSPSVALDHHEEIDDGGVVVNLSTATMATTTVSVPSLRGHTIKRRQVVKKKDAIKWNSWDRNNKIEDEIGAEADPLAVTYDEPDSPLDAASMPLSCFGDSIPHIDSDEDSSDEARKNDSCKLG